MKMETTTNSAQDVLRLFFENPPMSQVEAARHMRITRAASNLHFHKLAAERYIRPLATRNCGRGRPIQLWELDPQSLLFLGITLGNGSLQAELIDCSGNILGVRKENFTPDISFERLHRQLFALIETLLPKAEACGSKISQCYLATPGVHRKDGAILQAANLPVLNGWCPDQDIEQAFGIPTFCDSFNAPMIQGETEECDEKSTVVLLNWDDGFSAIFANHGQQLLWPEPNLRRWRILWDIGHLCIDPNGRPCRCGKRGCLEAYTGGLALAQMHPELGCSDSRELAQCACDGNPIAVALLRQAVRLLIRTLYTPFELFGVDTIIFTNTMASAFPCFETAVREELAKLYPAEELEKLSIRHSLTTEEKVRHGAALTARQFFFYPEKFRAVRGLVLTESNNPK